MSATHPFYTIFLKPLIEARPPGASKRRWVDFLFGVDSRTINRYVVIKEFEMPGKLVVPNTCLPVAGLPKRHIKRRRRVFVRQDESTPNVIDLEVQVDKTSQYNWYKLNADEFKKVKKCLRLKKFRVSKRKSVFWA